MTPSQIKTPHSPIMSVSPVPLSAPGRSSALEVKVSSPLSGSNLPVIIFSHGFGSSMDGYAPLANFWASQGFVVIQPTFLDSTTFSLNPPSSHAEAVKEYLGDPRKLDMWRYRVEDVKSILDQLDFIEGFVPVLKGRLNQSQIFAVGHSYGAGTTAMLLGARILDSNGKPGDDYSDSRIKAGVLLCAGGRGGDALTPFALEHFPHLNTSYAELTTPTLVVAGDKDDSPLTNLGPEWFTDAYKLSPGADCLGYLHGGEHMLGGISGYHVTETTDENPERVAAVQQLTSLYLLDKANGGDKSREHFLSKLGDFSKSFEKICSIKFK